MAPFRRLLPTAYRSFAPNASVQKRARNAWHVRARLRSKREGSKSDGKLPLQDLFVLRAGRRDDDGLRRDDERALRRGCTLEHLLDHGLERGHDRALGDMLGRAADLIAFERLGIVDGDGDAAVIRGEVAQRRVTHRRRRACRRPSRP